MGTVRLFDQNAYLKTCRAEVLSCERDAEGFLVVLDQTCFYPEGGGQPGDRGRLGGVQVLDTQEREGVIVHRTDGPLTPGSMAEGEIDWERRFDLMQQHTGEHMVSGIIHSRFGLENVGFHMGAELITIDISGVLTWEELEEVEAAVNCRIWENLEIKTLLPNEEERRTLPYRSKKALAGTIRVVEIPGTDLCACCGTHVRRTGEVGIIKLLNVEKFHSGVRIEMVSGRRAYEHLAEVMRQNRRVAQMLSVRAWETAGGVEALQKELEAQKQRGAEMEQKFLNQRAETLRDQGNVLRRWDDLTPDSLRRLTICVQEICGGCAAMFSGTDEKGYRYAVGEKNGDLRDLVREMNAALDGRGGGRGGFAQGAVNASWDEIQTFFSERNRQSVCEEKPAAATD